MNILEQVPSEAKIKSLIAQMTFGRRIFCPRCGSSHVRCSEKRYRCPDCRRPFSRTSVSWLSGMKISYRQLWLLIVCWQKRIAFETTCELAGVSAITARRWFRRFRYHLVYESPYLGGVVEVDEAFLGRRRFGNQKVVLGAFERKSRSVVVRMTHNREQETTDRFILKHIERGSAVCTDSAPCYEGIDSFFGYRHETCNHSKFVFGPTNLIENVWSRLKGYIRRTYHHYHKEWLPSLLREFEARVNAPELFISPLNFLETSLVAVPTR